MTGAVQADSPCRGQDDAKKPVPAGTGDATQEDAAARERIPQPLPTLFGFGTVREKGPEPPGWVGGGHRTR